MLSAKTGPERQTGCAEYGLGFVIFNAPADGFFQEMLRVQARNSPLGGGRIIAGR